MGAETGKPRTRGTPAAHAAPAHSLDFSRFAWLLLALWTVVIAYVAVVRHQTPLYSAESDTIGEYLPAARELRAGVLSPAHYQSKGFGYPLLVAAAGALAGGDDFLAARVLNVGAAAAGGAFAFVLFRAFLGAELGAFVLLGLLANPLYARLAIEAGTDVPTFALLLGATWLVLRRRDGRSLALAGLLAGFATITRYNAAFLLPAAMVVLLRRPKPAAGAAAYLAGFALPLAAWWIAAAKVGVSGLGTSNVANVAYEFYGRSMTPEVFASATGRRFRTLADVIAYQPAAFFARLAANVGTRWLEDARTLLPPWLGWLALPGLVLGWWGRPGWRGMALHAALCYVTLTAVFYLARFGLYLVPFYLSGIVALAWLARLPWAKARPKSVVPAGAVFRRAALVLVFAATAVRAVGDVRQGLATEPLETRDGGLALRAFARTGDRVMARKPHAAYFARLDYVPLPDRDEGDLAGLLRQARSQHARFLFFSVAEKVSRPQAALLAYRGVNLPGFRQLAFRMLDPQHWYALYELDGTAAPAAVDSAVVGALRGLVERQPELTWPRLQLAVKWLDDGHPAQSLDVLAPAERLSPADPAIARVQARAHQLLGDAEGTAAAAERAIRLGSRTGMERGALGWARVQQRRWPEAAAALGEALALDPANVTYRAWRALARAEHGDGAGALDDAKQVLALEPGEAQASLVAARVLHAAGRDAEARALLAAARPADEREVAEVRALAATLGPAR